jgi:hypothetical protein
VVFCWWERGDSVVKRGVLDAYFWESEVAPTFGDYSVENLLLGVDDSCAALMSASQD